MHIENLYKNVEIMNFKECYAMEKVHGTSTKLVWKNNSITFYSGGMKHETFVNIFNITELHDSFIKHFEDVEVIVYGEGYGGKEQGMSETYGKIPNFIVFEVQIGDTWLNVPNAKDVANKLGLEFVPYNKCSTDLESLNYQRNLPSIVAQRRGIKEAKVREGIVCKPLEEFINNRGNRIIVKHKNDEFMETKTPREVDPEQLKILTEANEIADEWVTEMRLNHVLDKLGNPSEIEKTPLVIKSMIEDVIREAKNEIVESRAAKCSIGKLCAKLYKERISKIK